MCHSHVLYDLYQALGCLLYKLCYQIHPFEDSAKLRILSANYKLPSDDTIYVMFHNIIRELLVPLYIHVQYMWFHVWALTLCTGYNSFASWRALHSLINPVSYTTSLLSPSFSLFSSPLRVLFTGRPHWQTIGGLHCCPALRHGRPAEREPGPTLGKQALLSSHTMERCRLIREASWLKIHKFGCILKYIVYLIVFFLFRWNSLASLLPLHHQLLLVYTTLVSHMHRYPYVLYLSLEHLYEDTQTWGHRHMCCPNCCLSTPEVNTHITTHNLIRIVLWCYRVLIRGLPLYYSTLIDEKGLLTGVIVS